MEGDSNEDGSVTHGLLPSYNETSYGNTSHMRLVNTTFPSVTQPAGSVICFCFIYVFYMYEPIWGR